MTDWRTAGLENFGVFQPRVTDGRFEIPRILPERLPAVEWTGFNYARGAKGARLNTGATRATGVHFFLDDYQFRAVWEYPERYAQALGRFGAVLSPDFSTYADMPQILQLWNHYRKHWLGAFWQSRGLTVVPTISWSTPASWEWCFDGEPHGGAVAISTVGVERDKSAFDFFVAGYQEMITRLQPSQILVYGKRFEFMTEDYLTVVEPFFKQMRGRSSNSGLREAGKN